MMRRSWVVGVAIVLVVGVGAVFAACGDGQECQVLGENCSAAYRRANNITYGCCAGLTCQTGASGVESCR